MVVGATALQDAVALLLVVAVMKLLLWALQSAWDLTMTKLKRAMAFLHNMEVISKVLLLTLNQRIKGTHLKILEDSVRHLTLTHITLTPIGVEET